MQLADIYVALEDELQPLAPAHARHDLHVEAIRLRKPDALSYWSAELDVINPAGGPFRPGAKRAVIISERDEDTGALRLVLSGYLEAWPLGPAGRIVTVTVLAKPKDAEARMAVALNGVNDDPFNVFAYAGEQADPAVRLAARSATLHWSRDALAMPELVDIVEGKAGALIDVGDAYIDEGLRFEQLGQPVERIDVTVKAQWTQAFLQTEDVARILKEKGNLDEVVTLTNDWDKIPKPGDKVGDWTVLRSAMHLQEIPQGMAKWSPFFVAAASSNKRANLDPEAEAYEIAYPRFGYRLEFMVGGVFTARRTETLTFSLVWDGQPLSGTSGRVETIDLTLKNLEARPQLPEWQTGAAYQTGDRVEADGLRWQCRVAHVAGASLYEDFDRWDALAIEPSVLGGAGAAVFFSQPGVITKELPSGATQTVFRNPAPGLACLRYAVGRARAQMLAANRIVRAVVDVPWADVREALHGKERLRVADPDIPGGEMTGKVEAVEVNLVEGVASVTIACIPGRGRRDPSPAIPAYAVRGFGRAGLVRADISNAWFKQESELMAAQYPDSTANLDSVLDRHPTRYSFDFTPVPRGGDYAVEIPLGTLTLDSHPQIDLEAAA